MLLEAGANVTVISPELHPELSMLADQGQVHHLPRGYLPGDLKGSRIAFVGTDDRSVNADVAQEGRESRVLVNAVDDTENCDFIMPSIVRQGDLTVAISTAGVSPAAARKIREEFEEQLTEEYALLLEVAGEVRRELREQRVIIDTETWNSGLDDQFRSLLKAKCRQEAKEHLLLNLLDTGGCPVRTEKGTNDCGRCSFLAETNR